jgi:hypothetical protein
MLKTLLIANKFKQTVLTHSNNDGEIFSKITLFHKKLLIPKDNMKIPKGRHSDTVHQ